jgi:hypothetical protein
LVTYFLQAELKVLDVAQYGLGSGRSWRHDKKPLAKILYDIDIKAGALQSKNFLNDFTKFLNLPENKSLVVKLLRKTVE